MRPGRQQGFQLHEINPEDGERGPHSNFLYQRITRLWNELPRDTVMADDINAFKNNLDAHLDEHPIKYDNRAAMSNTDIEE